MGSGGGKNKGFLGALSGAAENIGNVISDTHGNATHGVTKNFERELKKPYDELTGENARKKEQAEKDALKKTKKMKKKAKAKHLEGVKLGEDRAAAEGDRRSAANRQGRRSKSGRRSTILTDTLGGTGGEESRDRKSLLGY